MVTNRKERLLATLDSGGPKRLANEKEEGCVPTYMCVQHLRASAVKKKKDICHNYVYIICMNKYIDTNMYTSFVLIYTKGNAIMLG